MITLSLRIQVRDYIIASKGLETFTVHLHGTYLECFESLEQAIEFIIEKEEDKVRTGQ